MNNIIKQILNFAKQTNKLNKSFVPFLLGHVKLMNYPNLFISESELLLLTLTSEGWSFPRAFSFISMACLKNASAGLQTTGKKKTLSFGPLSFSKTRRNDKKSTIYSDNSNVNLICEQQNRATTSFEDPKRTFLKLSRNKFEIIAHTDM